MGENDAVTIIDHAARCRLIHSGLSVFNSQFAEFNVLNYLQPHELTDNDDHADNNDGIKYSYTLGRYEGWGIHLTCV